MTDLNVDAVDLTTLPEARLTQAMAQSGATFHELVVTVTNRGDATQFVPTDVTRIRYDPGTRVLHVRSGDDEADELALCPPHPVAHIQVRPGAQNTIEYRLVSPITYTTADGTMQAVRIDTDVAAIDCTVAYCDHEPPEILNLTARPPHSGTRRELHTRWQRAVAHGVSRGES